MLLSPDSLPLHPANVVTVEEAQNYGKTAPYRLPAAEPRCGGGGDGGVAVACGGRHLLPQLYCLSAGFAPLQAPIGEMPPANLYILPQFFSLWTNSKFVLSQIHHKAGSRKLLVVRSECNQGLKMAFSAIAIY
ncbi:hypothetical protein U1Q18_014406 [Sarracenia purpurea var. burkii]